LKSYAEFLCRYFVVLDDIWDESAWDILRCALPKNDQASRVITTTRIETVAIACCNYRNEYVYKLEPLDDQLSKRLFFKRIFGSEDAFPEQFREVSTEILDKCSGLPLAIVSISSLLANEATTRVEQWEHVRNSLGNKFGKCSALDGMRQILQLSYRNLPYYLKACFLYLGIYPEDYTIRRKDVVRQWVAEGFVSKVQGQDAEDVASNSFNELVNRSMILPNDVNYQNEVLSCKVHDMMLNLILNESPTARARPGISRRQRSALQNGTRELASPTASAERAQPCTHAHPVFTAPTCPWPAFIHSVCSACVCSWPRATVLYICTLYTIPVDHLPSSDAESYLK